jgi:hypothetical protein
MRGRAGAAVRRPVGRLCPWPVSCEKYETGIILHCRSEIVELVRHVISNLKLNFGARRRDGRRHESPTGHLGHAHVRDPGVRV